MQVTCIKNYFILQSDCYMKKYLNLILSLVALVAVIILTISHFEYDGPLTILFILLAISLGYWFGQWTCHLHQKHYGFWLTVGVFSILNLLHSMIDGASIGEVASFTSGLAILSHELVRQPALYLVLWGMLTPFVSHRLLRLLIVPVTVSGVWLVGVFFGHELFLHLESTPWLELVADQALFLFVGDIFHHIREEYYKLKQGDDCCHEHHLV